MFSENKTICSDIQYNLETQKMNFIFRQFLTSEKVKKNKRWILPLFSQNNEENCVFSDFKNYNNEQKIFLSIFEMIV